ncbi:putative FAD-linked sulfhydryl oxidase [Tripterygium wilfordii]|uniref:Sulfhydryl oxidase n=1 Tax=Tripterygium wilfordii TaxID=458696 RepID=A0A7J7CCG8_TRIWF|nr:FAD-linked sulfhydryl oxidase ERV1 [Tripterygium wilfordii]KAF5731848.1 putative FAD-linked sulfhydryl oxidase [Tripterygium wilfordii]
MSDNPMNPWQPLFQNVQKFSICIQTHLFKFIDHHSHHPSPPKENPLFSLHSSTSSKVSPINHGSTVVHAPDSLSNNKEKATAPVTKEELGRATWTFLHTLAAQYPEKPTRQQKKDVKELMAILTRMYPCKECADHFKEVLRANPVQAGSHAEFSRWLCHAHNVVNRSLGKLVVPCERVDARWGKMDCEHRACDLQGTTTSFGD